MSQALTNDLKKYAKEKKKLDTMAKRQNHGGPHHEVQVPIICLGTEALKWLRGMRVAGMMRYDADATIY